METLYQGEKKKLSLFLLHNFANDQIPLKCLKVLHSCLNSVVRSTIILNHKFSAIEEATNYLMTFRTICWRLCVFYGIFIQILQENSRNKANYSSKTAKNSNIFRPCERFTAVHCPETWLI